MDLDEPLYFLNDPITLESLRARREGADLVVNLGGRVLLIEVMRISAKCELENPVSDGC